MQVIGVSEEIAHDDGSDDFSLQLSSSCRAGVGISFRHFTLPRLRRKNADLPSNVALIVRPRPSIPLGLPTPRRHRRH